MLEHAVRRRRAGEMLQHVNATVTAVGRMLSDKHGQFALDRAIDAIKREATEYGE